MNVNGRFMVWFLLMLLGGTGLGGLLGILLRLWDEALPSFLIGAGLTGLAAFVVAFIVARRKAKPARVTAVVTFLVFGSFTGFWFSVFITPPEGLYVLYPDVDTRFAPGYSDAAFDSVQTGMTESQVKALLNEPLYKSAQSESNRYPGRPDCVWAYTGDGACSWSDFAWRSRVICFRKGVVVEKLAAWCYD